MMVAEVEVEEGEVLVWYDGDVSFPDDAWNAEEVEEVEVPELEVADQTDEDSVDGEDAVEDGEKGALDE